MKGSIERTDCENVYNRVLDFFVKKMLCFREVFIFFHFFSQKRNKVLGKNQFLKLPISSASVEKSSKNDKQLPCFSWAPSFFLQFKIFFLFVFYICVVSQVVYNINFTPSDFYIGHLNLRKNISEDSGRTFEFICWNRKWFHNTA